jgi:hypothetical protein|tara:strand:- start:1064 stop:1333 length:270 start_codon:yes stop_codon:yes gene_type:complete
VRDSSIELDERPVLEIDSPAGAWSTLPSDRVTQPKPACSAEAERTNMLRHAAFVITVPSHAVVAIAVVIEQHEIRIQPALCRKAISNSP